MIIDYFTWPLTLLYGNKILEKMREKEENENRFICVLNFVKRFLNCFDFGVKRKIYFKDINSVES